MPGKGKNKNRGKGRNKQKHSKPKFKSKSKSSPNANSTHTKNNNTNNNNNKNKRFNQNQSQDESKDLVNHHHHSTLGHECVHENVHENEQKLVSAEQNKNENHDVHEHSNSCNHHDAHNARAGPNSTQQNANANSNSNQASHQSQTQNRAKNKHKLKLKYANPKQNQNKNRNKKNKKTKISPAMQKKNAGNRAFQNENFALAIKLYTEAIALEPSEHTLYSNRSAAHLLNIDYDAALIDAQKCIQLQPNWQKGYVRKASVLCKLKKLDEANQTYLNAKQLCTKTDLIQKAMNELEILRMEDLDEDSRMVGGHHAQATKFRTLINWLIQGGAQFPKLYLKFYSPEYRAIHALEDIYVDEDICFIPHDYIMTSDVAKQSEIGQKIIAAKVELRSKHSYLASYLLQEREKGEQSKWHVYITILPRKFETIPLFFNEEQRKALIGSIAIKKIDDRLESLRLEHEAICAGVPEFSRFDLNDFIWARLVVITRIFGLVVDDNKTDGLVPMADMLNHKRPRETKWTYSQEKHGFLITALQNISSNHEIFDSYGRKCNSRFFVNYGFSLEFNLDNEALMSFELPQSDPQFTIKAHHLGYSGHDFVKRDFQIPMQYKEKKVKECFSFLRVLHAQGNEFLIISSSDGLKVTDIPPLSIRNEINVLTSMAVSATRSLQKFETTLQFDNQLLEDEEKYPRFSNPRNAILMRRGEKDVLTNYVHLRKICIPLFKLRYKDLRVRLRRNKRFRDPDSPLMMYVNSVVVPLVQRQSS